MMEEESIKARKLITVRAHSTSFEEEDAVDKNSAYSDTSGKQVGRMINKAATMIKSSMSTVLDG